MDIRPEFQRFIGSGSWGKQQGFYKPTMEELQAGAFQLPLDRSQLGAMHRMHLDLLNIGHNVEGFNQLPEETRQATEAIFDRRGTYAEIRQLPQGDMAAIHTSNAFEAQRSLVNTLMGPGLGVFQAMEALAPRMPGNPSELVSIGTGMGSTTCVAADVYPVETVNLMGQDMKGITGDPIGRVYIDLTNGTAFLMPDDKFHGRS